jgi:hypothetical protein
MVHSQAYVFAIWLKLATPRNRSFRGGVVVREDPRAAWHDGQFDGFQVAPLAKMLVSFEGLSAMAWTRISSSATAGVADHFKLRRNDPTKFYECEGDILWLKRPRKLEEQLF